MKRIRPILCLLILLALLPAIATAEYSAWSFFGGLNFTYNSDGEGVSIPGMQANGDPGGLASAPSPLEGFLGAEYRLPLKPKFFFAPSASLYMTRYLWANDRALPAEIENRTAYVPVLILDNAFLYHIEKDRFQYAFGGGPALVIRYGFLESGVGKDEQNAGDSLNAGDQVKAVNKYFWSSGRWLYPMLQGSVRYRLETGWGAGFTMRVGIPFFNLWATPKVTFADSLMIMAALTITPPTKKTAATVQATADSSASDDSTAK